MCAGGPAFNPEESLASALASGRHRDPQYRELRGSVVDISAFSVMRCISSLA